MDSAHPLESLVVCIPGERKSDPSAQAEETLRIAGEVCAELAGLRKKCAQIKELDGKPAFIVGLKLTGQTSVEKVEVTYLQDTKPMSREYSIDDFYHI